MAVKKRSAKTKGGKDPRSASRGLDPRLLWAGGILVALLLLMEAMVLLKGTRGPAGTAGTPDPSQKAYKVLNFDGIKTLKATAGWNQDGSNDPSRDKAVGGEGLRIRGKAFRKGIGTHAPSEIVFDLGGKVSKFTCLVGADEGGGGSDRVIFRVLADGQELFKSPVMTTGQEALPVEVQLEGKKELTLKVDYGPGADSWGHADWVDLKFIRSR